MDGQKHDTPERGGAVLDVPVLPALLDVELLAGRMDPDLLGEEELAAPHLIDSEVAHVLRGLSVVARSARGRVRRR